MTRRAEQTRKNPDKTDRRSFLKGAAALGGGVLAGTVLPASAQSEAVAESVKQPATAETGYRVTEHIARYYETLKS